MLAKNRNFEKLALICAYLLSSMLTTVTNKYVISVIRFKMLFFYLGIQSLFISIILFILSSLNILKIKPINRSIINAWLPCSVLLTFMIYTNAKCMVYLTISIYTLFKDFTIILVAAGEYVLHKKKLDINTIIAFTLILLSSSLAKFSCPNTSIYGYCWCILNILSTSSYILLYKYNLSTEKNSNSEAVFYCNFLSIPFLLFGFAIIDSKDFRLCSLNSSALGIFFLILLSSISAFFISYTTAWCLRLLSSTSYSVLGAINKIIVSFSGILIIGEGRVSALKILSLIIGSLAGIIYSKRIKNE